MINNITAVFLSKTVDKEVLDMTVNAMETLLNSLVLDIKINIVLVESEKDFKCSYPSYVNVIIPKEEFNFHKFLNIGIKSIISDWYLLCNNDIEFDSGWLEQILLVINERADINSFSPLCPLSTRQCKLKKITRNKLYTVGFEPVLHISGWCILLKNSVVQELGGLDERFNFYFADDDYGLSLREHNLKHALVFNSLVTHLEHMKISKKIVGKKDEIEKPKHIPSYLYWKRFSWILTNPKMLDGYMKLYNKWGDWRVLKFKKYLHNMLIRLGINCFGSFLFKSN